eukprot:8087180-Pyramimonas_sp.AAC.1
MLSRHVKDPASVRSHSLRKGGALRWKHAAALPATLVQAQGGWSSLDVMRAFYAKHPDSDRRQLLLGAAAAANPKQAAPSANAQRPLLALPEAAFVINLGFGGVRALPEGMRPVACGC